MQLPTTITPEQFQQSAPLVLKFLLTTENGYGEGIDAHHFLTESSPRTRLFAFTKTPINHLASHLYFGQHLNIHGNGGDLIWVSGVCGFKTNL
jgi:hypothetical protein